MSDNPRLHHVLPQSGCSSDADARDRYYDLRFKPRFSAVLHSPEKHRKPEPQKYRDDRERTAYWPLSKRKPSARQKYLYDRREARLEPHKWESGIKQPISETRLITTLATTHTHTHTHTSQWAAGTNARHANRPPIANALTWLSSFCEVRNSARRRLVRKKTVIMRP